MSTKKRISVTIISIILTLSAIYTYIAYPEQFSYYCQTGFDECKMFQFASGLSTFFAVTIFSISLLFSRKEVYKTWFTFTLLYIVIIQILSLIPTELNSVSTWSITGLPLLILDLLIYIIPALGIVVLTYLVLFLKEKVYPIVKKYHKIKWFIDRSLCATKVLHGDTILASSSIQAIPTATSTKVSIILSSTNITKNTISVDLDADTVVDITASPVSGTSTVYYAPQAIDTPVLPIAVQLSQVSYSQSGGSGGSLYSSPPLLKTEAVMQTTSTTTDKILTPKEKVMTKQKITKKNKPIIKKKVIKQIPVTKLKPITKTLEPLAGTPKPPETLQVKPLTLKQRIINYFKLQ